MESKPVQPEQPPARPGAGGLPGALQAEIGRSWPVVKIVGLYALIGALWILFSDTIAQWLVPDARTLTRIAILKGLGYVAATAGLLYVLIQRHLNQYRRALRALHESQEKLALENVERRQTEEFLRESKRLLGLKTEQLQTADIRKNEFLAMLAHELRNPMAPLLTTVELLRLKTQSQDPWLGKQIGVIRRQVAHLSRIVDDLLDISRISQGLIALKKERVNLADIVSPVVDMERELALSRQITLAVDLPPEPVVLPGDPVRLIQILSNLVHNALKFTPEHGQVAVTVARQAGQAVVTVEDNGVGIAPEKLPHIFQLFYQANRNADQAKGSLGLGLTLVKQLTLLHGGTVAANSPGLGCGARFEVRLPLQETPSPAPREAAPPETAEPVAKILLVADDAEAGQALTEVLRHWGYRTWTTRTADQAVELALNVHPDLVLFDIRQPGLHGYQICSHLQSQPSLTETLRLALAGPEGVTAPGNECFHSFLAKPVPMDDLRAALKDLVGRSRPSGAAVNARTGKAA